MSQSFTDDWYAASANALAGFAQAENNDLALKSCFSGTSAPSNPVAGMLWMDTANGILKIRNIANSGWVNLFSVSQVAALALYISINAGSGLTGGGVLTADRTLAIAAGGVVNNHLGSRIVHAANIALGGVGAENMQNGLMIVASEFHADDYYTISSTSEATITKAWFRCPTTPQKLRLAYRGRASGTNLDTRMRVNSVLYSSYARQSSGTAAWAEIADCDISSLTPGTHYLIELRAKLTGSGSGYFDNFIISHSS